MTTKLFDVDGFKAAAKDGARPEGTVLRLATADPEVVADSRVVRFVFSDESVDRAGDRIMVDGWDVADFKRNPVALFAHSSWDPPIGIASNVGVKDGKLAGDIEFADAETYAFADTIYRLVKGKFLRAVSVGFMPTEWKFVDSKDRPFAIDFLKQVLLEISVCPVPCNPNALQEAKAHGIDTSPLREWASKVLDEGGSILVPRDLLEETFRQAKTPRTVRQKYLAKAEGSDWKAGAARDLPTDDSDAWDGPAASKRMLDDAGFDGDSPDATKAARGFLIHDAANPTLRGSYKLPFADIVGGALKAIKGGVIAAKGRLDQTDAPAAVLDDAKAVVAGYEAKFGEGEPKSMSGRLKEFHAALATSFLTPAELELLTPEELAEFKAEMAAFRAALEKNAPPVAKAGRRISSANEAQLREAMGHHESATKCIQTVLDSNAAAGPEDDTDPNDLEVEVPLTDEAKRAKRVREARALKASVTA